MKKFNPVEYMRERWGDKAHTKNHPKQCAHDHQFCHLEYEWANDNHAANTPVNQVQVRPFSRCPTSICPTRRTTEGLSAST